MTYGLRSPSLLRALWLAAALACGLPAAFAQEPIDWTEGSEVRAERVADSVFGGNVMIYRAGPPGADPVVLVHGLGPSGAGDWRKLIPALAGRYEVFALDLPGFGRSDKENRLYSPANFARVIDAVLAKRISRPFVLIGHSLGGAVCLAYGAAYPERMSRLVLVDAAGILQRAVYAEFLGRGAAEQAFGKNLRSVPWLDSFVRTVLTRAEDLPVSSQIILTVPLMREKLLRADPTAIAAYALIEHDFSHELRSIKAPTLVIWGAEDRVAPLRTGELVAAAIQGARLAVIDGAGHTPMLETPEQFNGLVLDELDGRLRIDPYAMPRGAPGDRVARCEGLRAQRFTGDYKEIRLNGCPDVQITNARVGALIARKSVVRLVNSHVYGGVDAADSRLELTAGIIGGETALTLAGGSVDAAGTRFEPRGKIADNRGKVAVALFLSVSESARAGEPSRYLHQVVRLPPGGKW
jgi:pimeloyl-ACP methyl ester carboxylesterase